MRHGDRQTERQINRQKETNKDTDREIMGNVAILGVYVF